jgi:transketolase C-terminal domain/subunit
VLVFNQLHPLNDGAVLEALKPHGRIIVVEDHLPLSGLYGSLCEFAARHSLRGRLESVAPTGYAFDVGASPDYFYRKFGLDVSSLLKLSGN